MFGDAICRSPNFEAANSRPDLGRDTNVQAGKRLDLPHQSAAGLGRGATDPGGVRPKRSQDMAGGLRVDLGTWRSGGRTA
jgi:hypothetical protein